MTLRSVTPVPEGYSTAGLGCGRDQCKAFLTILV